MDFISWFPTTGKVVRAGVNGTIDFGLMQLRRSTFGGRHSDVLEPASDFSTPNTSVCVRPQGNGAFYLGLPADGTAVGGNVRGANAVDVQQLRGDNNRVAAGAYSFVGGNSCWASHTASFAFGTGCLAWADYAVATGEYCTASGAGSFAGGHYTTASGSRAFAFGHAVGASGSAAFATGQQTGASGSYSAAFGYFSAATLYGELAHSAGVFATVGDSQHSWVCSRVATTNATITEAFLDGASQRLNVPANATMEVLFEVVARTSTAAGTIESATFTRKVLVSRGSAANTTTIVGQNTVGTDIASAGAVLWAVTFSADTTNGAVRQQVTGAAATNIRWTINAHIMQVIYA